MKLTKQSKKGSSHHSAAGYLAVTCRALGRIGFHPRGLGLVRSGIYISLFAAWGFSLQTRIMQSWQRRYMVAIAICMSFWFLTRTLKYHFIPAAAMPGATRLLWYAYYIPMLLIPMLSVYRRHPGKSPNNTERRVPCICCGYPRCCWF